MALGIPRGEMLRRMSSEELSGWMAFYRLEPFGGDTEYIGAAITASVVANTHLVKNQKPYEAKDFLPKFGKGEQGVNEQIQIAEMFTAGLGGQDLRREDD